jgi:DNA invertase Pin-like site-specific DNA recombinase
LFAEYENEQRREWIIKAHGEIAERGSWPGGHLPFGYRYSNDHFVEVDSDAAALVRYIFERKAEKVPRTTIAAELNERGQETPRGKGTWGHTTIGTILRNRAYIGERELNGEIFKADIPAIIERKVWEKCNR